MQILGAAMAPANTIIEITLLPKVQIPPNPGAATAAKAH